MTDTGVDTGSGSSSGGGSEHDEDLVQRLLSFIDEEGSAAAMAALRQLEVGLADGSAPGPGSMLGEFRLVREIGRGGMGVIYEAEQASVPGRRVALKVLARSSVNAVRLHRFAREIEVVGRLDHPNIVPILSADLRTEVPWYAMKLMTGRTLREEADDGEQPDYGSIARRFRDLALALQHAHDHGVVHRDVNPRNVMIEPDGTPMLLDFGLAHDDRADRTLTQGEDALGTVDSMAPEQVSARAGEVCPASDVYGLGATLYRCLAGRSPFPAGTLHETFQRVLAGHPVSPCRIRQHVPRDLAAICLKAMAPAIRDRYRDAAAMADDLEAFLEFRPVSATSPGSMSRVWRRIRQHRSASLGVATVLLALGGTWGYLSWWKPWTVAQAAEAALSRGDLQAAEQRAVVLAADYAGTGWAWRGVEVQRRIAARRIDDGLLEVATLIEQRDAREAEARATHAELLDLAEVAPSASGEILRSKLLAQLDHAELELASLNAAVGSELEALVGLDDEHVGFRRAVAGEAAVRVRHGLADLANWRDPVALEHWEDRLRTYDDEGLHAALIDRRGDLSVECPQGPARVWLCPVSEQDGRLLYVEAGPDAGAIDLGMTPTPMRRVVEGNYMVRLARPGCVETKLPMLLRRAAVQAPGEQSLRVDVFPREEIGEGWVFVPAGFSVLGDARRRRLADARPSLTWVDSFFIMEDEVTEQRFVEVLENSGEAHLDRMLGEVLDGSASDRPIAGLKANDAENFFQKLNVAEIAAAAKRPWFYRLPQPEEWERAGRGGDGRLYPWGDLPNLEYSANYWSCTDEDQAFTWRPSPAEDTSPFGVRAMAGGVAEVCSPANAINTLGKAKVWVRGGSVNSRTPEELQLIAEQVEDAAVRREAAGFRLIRRRLPFLEDDAVAVFHETFDGASSDGLPDGWSAGLKFDEVFGQARRAFVEDGALHLRGYGGHFSRTVLAWHPISLPASSWRVTATFSIECGRTSDLMPDRGGFFLRLVERPEWRQGAREAVAAVSCTGVMTVNLGSGRTPDGSASRVPVSWADQDMHLELLMRDGRLEARLWPVTGSRPAEPQLVDTHASVEWRPRTLLLEAGNLESTRIRVDQVLAEPL